MDRREFFGMGGGAAAATALRSAGINVDGRSDPAVAHVKALLAAALGGLNPPTNDGPLTVSISGEFMEDYTAGTPWMGSPMKIEVPYVSRNGTAQIYSFQGRWNQANPEIVERVYADPDPEKFPGQDTLTGWTYESKQLPVQDPNWAQNYNPPTAFIISYTDYHQLDPVLLPQGKSKPDMLLVYRDAAIYSAPLGDDGSVGEFRSIFRHPNPPLVQGPLPEGTKYIFENWVMENCSMRNGGRWPDCQNGPGLRDVDTLAYYPIDWNNLFTAEGLGFVKIIPLSGDGVGEYTCVALETDGKVTYLRLKLDGNLFRVISGPPIVLGHTDNGLVTAVQDSSGLAQVFFFDLPAIRTVQVYHNSQSGIVHQELQTVELPDFQMPNYPANMRYDIKCQFNPTLRQPEILITVKDPIRTPNGGSYTDPVMELWTTSRLKKGWDKLTPADKGVRNVLMAAAQSPTLFIQRPRTGFEHWVRNEGGDWNSVHIRTETGDGELLESAGYRVGITLKRDGVAVTTGEFGLSATVASPAVIRGRHGTLGMHRPWQAKCDPTGTLWVTVLLENRTTFPQLAITSDQFADRLVLDLNHRIEGFMSTVTSDQLLKARDPRHCTEQETDGCSAAEISSGLDEANAKPGITDPEKAEKTAKSIRDTLTTFTPSTALSKTTSKPIQVDSRIPWGWLPLSQDLSVLHPVVAKNSGPSFRIFRKDGVPHLELVSHEVARARAAELRSMHPAYVGDGFASLGTGYFGLFDFVTDAWDAIGDAAQAVWDGACQIGEAIVDGVNFTLHLVIDGLDWVFNAVMDTIDMIMDAIDFVLEYAGMALGMAVGWLLEQLGFLFDWKAIKERRDYLLDYIQKNLRPALNVMGRPVDGAAKFKLELVTVRREAFAALNTLRNTPAAEDAWKNAPPEGESVSSSFSFINDFSVFPQATWLMDKIMSALPRGKGLDQFGGLPMLDAAFAAFGQALTKASDNFFGVLTDLVKFFEQEFAQGKIITAQALDPMIELLQNLMARVFRMFEIIIDAGAQLLQIFWDNAETMLNLFHASIPIPAFFRGFYRGLTGNNPTPLDMACLLAAIPMSAEAYESPRNTAESSRPQAYPSSGPHLENAAYLRPRRVAVATARAGDGFPDPPHQTPAEIVSASFQGAGALVGAFGLGVTAFTVEGGWSDGLGMFGHACTIGSMIANLVDEKRWLTVGIGSAIGVVLAAIAYKMNGRSASIQPVSAAAAPLRGGGLIAALKERTTQALAITAAVQGLLAFFDIVFEGDINSELAHLATMCQLSLGVWVSSDRELFRSNPYASAFVGTINGILGGTVTGLYIYRPIPLLPPPVS